VRGLLSDPGAMGKPGNRRTVKTRLEKAPLACVSCLSCRRQQQHLIFIAGSAVQKEVGFWVRAGNTFLTECCRPKEEIS
jgi:hypothetical protein